MVGAFASLLFAIGAVFSADESAKETPRQMTVRKMAESLGTATLKGEYAKVIDLTWDESVAKMGGREKAIKAAEAGMKKIAADGWKIKSYKVRSVGEFHKEGEHSFIVVPTTLEITTPDSRIVSKNFLLGISKDDGKTWKFVDSAGIQDGEVRKKTLPPLPDSLKLPKREKPEVFKDK